jgi:general secretion pathway protein I
MSGSHHLPNAHRAAESGFKQEAGFSLLEVMVAILVLGIALAALTRGITTALRSSKESELQTIAALFAAGQIETLRAEGDLIDGEKEGDCGEGLPLYRWKETVSRTDIDGLHEVDVVIEHSGSGQAVYELQTMLFEPAEDATAKADAAKPGKGQKR